MEPLVTGLLLLNAHIVDADGARDAAAIVVEDGLITAIGDVPASTEGYEVIDVAGATVIPGLIDCHVHLSLAPSGFFRDDDDATVERQRRMYLNSYLAWGVTTVLDTGIPPEDAAQFKGFVAEGEASPDLYFLGPLLSPVGGYVAVVLPEFEPVATPEDVRAQFAEWDALDPVGVKVTIEEGMVSRIWPLYPDDVREEIVTQAAQRDWPLFVHGMSVKEHNLALDLNPRAMVHPVDKSNRKLAKRHKAQGTFVVSTLSAFESNVTEFEPERLDDPMVQLTVPAEQLASARDPEVLHGYKVQIAENILPRMPGFMKGMVMKLLAKKQPLVKRTAKMQKHLVTLHEHGVPLVMGSDSGNWPIFPFEFHGPTSVREVELLSQAGFSNQEVLAMATRNGAQMIGIDDDVGTVNVGKQADLVVLDGDPLQDIGALRRVRYTIADGEARTPQGWMGATGAER